MDAVGGMEAFTKVVELGSFSGAAKALRIPTSTLSRRISRLENHLGVQLLTRTTRQVHPTEAGHVYYERSKLIVEDIRAAEEAITQMDEKPRGVLRITAPSNSSSSFTDLIADYLLAHPEVKIELLLTNRYINLAEEGFDVAIRAGQLADSAMIARKLMTAEMRLVASPAYLTQYGTPETFADIEKHECITFLGGQNNRWTSITGESMTVSGRFQVNEIETVYHATLRGLGLALLPSLIVDSDIQKGHLLHLLPQIIAPKSGGIYAIYLPNRHLSPKIRSFVDWCVKHFTEQTMEVPC